MKKKRKRATSHKLRKLVANIKLKSFCVICHETHPATLEFHHIDPTQKEVTICNLTRLHYNKEILLKELSKCVVLCANCHKIWHWNEQQGIITNFEKPSVSFI